MMSQQEENRIRWRIIAVMAAGFAGAVLMGVMVA